MARNSTKGFRHKRGGSTSRAESSAAAAAARLAALEQPLLPQAPGQGNGHAEVKAWFPPSFCCHPLSEQATIGFLKKTADTSVMGLVTLSTLYATYLLAWGKSGSACIPKPKVSTDLSWVQILIGSLPFAVFPATLYVNGIVQAAEIDGHALGISATLCLIEFIAAITLGGGMLFCVSGWWWLWCVPALMMITMLLTWGLTFKYPKILRNFVWSTCFRQTEIVVVAPAPDDQALQVVVHPQ